MNQLVFTQILGETGYSFEIVGNGRKALDAFGRLNPRMILMDVSMPEMNGLEATAAIRRLEEETGTHVPIVGVTAHALKGDRERCLEAGMDDYLPKPISPKALLEKVERWVGACQRSPARRRLAAISAPRFGGAATVRDYGAIAPYQSAAPSRDNGGNRIPLIQLRAGASDRRQETASNLPQRTCFWRWLGQDFALATGNALPSGFSFSASRPVDLPATRCQRESRKRLIPAANFRSVTGRLQGCGSQGAVRRYRADTKLSCDCNNRRLLASAGAD